MLIPFYYSRKSTAVVQCQVLSVSKTIKSNSRQTYNRTAEPGRLVSQDVVYTNQFRNITRVRALDLNNNGTGGFASIVSGGIGFRNVTLRLRSSAVGRGYNFFVDIYGN